MPAVTATAGFCEVLLNELDAITGKNTPEMMQKKNGTLEALTSAGNKMGFDALPLGQGEGRVKQTRVRYLQRSCDDTAITSYASRTCGTGTEKAFLETTVDVNNYVGSRNIQLSNSEMRQLCVDSKAMGAWFRRNIMSEMNAVHTTLNNALLENIYNNCVGVNINNLVSGVPSASAKDITVLTGDCKTNCVDGINELLRDYSEHQYLGAPFIVAQGNFAKAMLNLKYGCCNQDGIDWNKVSDYISSNGFAFYDDHNVNSVVAQDAVLMLAPGASQVLFWNENAGDFEVQYNDVYAHTMFASPWIAGLNFDLDIHYDDCTKVYWLQFGVHYEPWCLPSDAFDDCDELAGVSGVWLYNAIAS